MNNQFIQDYQLPLSQSTAPSTSYNNSLWNNNSQYFKNSEEDKLKLQLKLKENQIESLTNEIKMLNESMLVKEDKESYVPYSINEIFNALTKEKLQQSNELTETKLKLDTLITSIVLNPTNDSIENGRYDELETSHKILIKLESLKRENEFLLKSLSFGKLKNFEMNLNLLKQENKDLKRENQELKKEIERLK